MLIGELIAGFGGLIIFAVFGGLLFLESLFALAGLSLEIVFQLLGNRGKAVKTAAQPERAGSTDGAPSVAPRRWFRVVATIASISLVLTVGLAILLNTVLFDWSVRQIIGRVESRTGIQIGYASTAGNLLLGRIELRDATMARGSDPFSNFDLQAEMLLVDLDVWRMIRGGRHVEDLRLVGMRGTVERLAKAERGPWYLRRATRLDHLVISDCDIRFVDHTRSRGGAPFAVDLYVTEMAAQNISTNWLAFHLLFRSNAAGAIAGQPFSIRNLRSNGGGETEWEFSNMPAAIFGEYIGGPFAWLDEGFADIGATTQWNEGMRMLSMDWQFDLRNVHAALPEELEGWRGRVGQAFVNQVNRRGEHFPLTFNLEMDSRGFEGSVSAEAAGLWEAVADAAMTELAAGLGISREAVQDVRERAGERIRNFRRPREDR